MEPFRLLAFGDTGWGDELALGLGVTLGLAVLTFPFAVALSFAVYMARTSRSRALQLAAQAYTVVFKSLPEILTLLILYYQAQALVTWLVRLISPQASLSISPFVAGMAALALVISAYGSEVVRAAFQAVGRGQKEAARSLGLSPFMSFRKVILPQVWRHALPGFGNLWIILLKDTSLVSVIALNDLTNVAAQAINTTRQPFLFYTPIGAVYVALVMVSARLQKRLEARAATGFTHGAARHA